MRKPIDYQLDTAAALLGFRIVNIFTLILDIPKEACSMHFKGIIDPRQEEYFHPFPFLWHAHKS